MRWSYVPFEFVFLQFISASFFFYHNYKTKIQVPCTPNVLIVFHSFIYLYANYFFILYACFYICISYFHLWQTCSFSADGKLLVSASDDQTVDMKHLMLFIFSLFSYSVLLFSPCILLELQGTTDLICKSISITPSENSVSLLLSSLALFSLILNVNSHVFFRFVCGTLKMESA